jgi:hypothetical protein
MKFFLKMLLSLVVLLAVLFGLAYWKPVILANAIWPLIETQSLRDPFVGITADGSVESGLFEIQPTGISTEPVMDAALAFLYSLDNDKKRQLKFRVDDLEWRRWSNIHIASRQGVGLLDMDEDQTSAAFGLLAASLSERGFNTARDIMRLEGHLSDLKDDYEQYGEKRYWFTMMGEPSAAEPWGWQIDGHHLIINYFVMGDQVVMTPAFMGSEPVSTATGRFAGTSILEEELTAGLTLINALNESQRSVAIVDPVKAANNNQGEFFQDNVVVPYTGLRLSEMTPEQSRLVDRLIGLYINHMTEGHARTKLAEIETHWDDTYFSWVGGTDADSIFYYRIHSPVILIEYDHQMPVALDGPERPTREHVHTVVRTPNGNDYGKDLLRQHLEQHPHGKL